MMGAGEEGAHALTEAGLIAYEIGDEAILDLREFSLNGPGMKAVRQSVSRLQRRGYTTRLPAHSTLTPGGLRASSRTPPGSGAGTAATSAASRWPWAGSRTRWTATA